MKSKNCTKTSFIYKTTLLCLALFAPTFANAGGLMITPNRIELDDNLKTQEVKLVNSSKETTSYRVSFQNLRMKENGTYEEIKNTEGAAEKFAENYIKFSPKRVTLQPGESQTIRLLAKAPSEEGEYRSHLLFKEEVPAELGNSVENQGNVKKEISVVLKPVFAISIPVILRTGNVSAKLTFEDLAITKSEGKDKNNVLNMNIKREGNGSANGKVVVNLLKKDSSKVEIGSLDNVSAYYPYENRSLAIDLKLPKGTSLVGGNLEVKFIARKSEGSSDQNDKIIAQTNYLAK